MRSADLPGRSKTAGLTHEPLVSIVTPTLNQGAFISDAIESVQGQTYRNVEHIVVDGGSTDSTLEVLRRSEASGLRWLSEPDRGMYEAIGKGFRLATGDVLAYLNSDDMYPPWAIEVAVSAFARDPDLDFVFGDGLAIDIGTGRQRLAFVPPFDANSMAWIGSLVQPAVFFRRRAFERTGEFDPDLKYVGDLDYWLRAGSHSKFGRVDEILAIERIHGGALSSASARPMAVEEALVRDRYRSIGPSRRVARKFWARARGAIWRRRLWLRFLRASRKPGPGRSWDRALGDGKFAISPLRSGLALVPRLGAPFAWNAIVSRRSWFRSSPPSSDGERIAALDGGGDRRR